MRLVVDGAHEAGVGACHCGMCRRWSGGVFMVFTAEAGAVTAEGPVRRHASSGFAERAFCATCGSHLWFRETGDAGEPFELIAGLFPDAAGFPLISEIYADRAPAWARFEGDHPRRTAAAYEADFPSVAGGAETEADADGLAGGCLCGAVTVAVEGGHPEAVGVCHCGMCRRWGDGVYADFAVAAGAVTVAGPVRRHASSDFAERAFCATCGSHLWFRETDRAGADYLLMPGLFAAAFTLTGESYADRAPAWARLAGHHPRTTRAEFEARRAHVQGD